MSSAVTDWIGALHLMAPWNLNIDGCRNYARFRNFALETSLQKPELNRFRNYTYTI